MSIEVPPTAPILGEDLVRVDTLARDFDCERDCAWNSDHLHDARREDADARVLRAVDVPAYASLGEQCHGTLLELALLHTLRPCRHCGGSFLYASAYQVGCCPGFGDADDCADCARDQCCGRSATNMNLADAITRWNLDHGDNGPRGRVLVIR